MFCRKISFWLAMLLGGCVARDPLPGLDGTDSLPDPGMTEVSVARLKSLYRGYPFTVTDPIELRVVVTANDRYGAFAGMIYVQDSTGGLGLKVGGGELYPLFPVGQPLRIGCRRLVLGGYGGTVSLGAASDDSDYQNGFIPGAEVSRFLKPYGVPREALPDTLTFRELGPERVGCLLAFTGVQFIDEETGREWIEGETDTDRHLVDARGDTLVVRTSHRADFASWKLPQGSGYIEGILDRFGRIYQLRVVSPKNVNMEGERFVPGER